MAYPPRNLTYGEVFTTLTKLGISLTSDTQVMAEDVHTGEIKRLHAFCRGDRTVGFAQQPAATPMSWTVLESIATGLGLTPDEFGLTAGWPRSYHLPDSPTDS